MSAAILRFIGVAFLLLAASPALAENWIGAWGTAPQHWSRGRLQYFQNQTARLIVHTTTGGPRVRIRVSNAYGELPLHIGGAHIARRASGADVDPASDRRLTFGGQSSATIAPHASIVSDAVDLDVPPLRDLAISVFFPDTALATTSHSLAVQTSYVADGDAAAAEKFPVAKTIAFWPFLVGVDVAAPANGASIVAFGSSITDGDGSTKDANKRWPDVLAERLQGCGAPLGVINEGIIGNRLLADTRSPRQSGGPFGAVLEDLGPTLGDSGMARFDRDVLDQPGARYVILALGINDILFPGAFTPANEGVTAQSVIDGNRALAARAHKKGLRVIGTTISAFEGAFFQGPKITFFTPEKETMRQQVNAWILGAKDFDGVIDFDATLRDPAHPTRLLPEFDSGDHLHPNDAGYVASAKAIAVGMFGCR